MDPPECGPRVVVFPRGSLDDIPDILGSMAKLAASNTGTQRVIADTNGIILELVGERIISLGHGSDEDANALLGSQILNVIPDSYHLCVE